MIAQHNLKHGTCHCAKCRSATGRKKVETQGKDRRESNVMVTVVDMDPWLKELCEKWKKDTKCDKKPDRFFVASDVGYVITDEGVYGLTREGVGDDDPIGETREESFGVPLYAHYGESMDLFACAHVFVSKESILELPVKGQEPLHSFIRSFGSRLECNYSMWERKLRDLA